MIKIYKLRDLKWLTICKREFKDILQDGAQKSKQQPTVKDPFILV